MGLSTTGRREDYMDCTPPPPVPQSVHRACFGTVQDLDLQAVQAFIISWDNPSSVTSLSVADLEDAVIVNHLIILISKLPCLQSLSVEAHQDHHIGYVSLLPALQWPDRDEDTSESPSEEDQSTPEKLRLCPQLSYIKLSRWSLDSRLLRDMILSRSAKTSVRAVDTVSAEQLELTDTAPSGGCLGWLRAMRAERVLKHLFIEE